MNPKIKHWILGIFSLILLLAPVFYLPSVVRDAKEIRAVKFGLPVAFVEQDFVCKNSFAYYPNYFRLNVKAGKDCPIKNFSTANFALSFLAIFLALEILIYILENLKFWLGELIRKLRTKK